MWLLRYTRYCICDPVPPCRAHVHNIVFTIIQFLRVRANIHTVLEGQQHVYCIQGNNGKKQILTNPLLCIQYRNTHPSGFASGFVFLYCLQISGNWSISPSSQLFRTVDHEIFVIKNFSSTPFTDENKTCENYAHTYLSVATKIRIRENFPSTIFYWRENSDLWYYPVLVYTPAWANFKPF